MDKEYKPIWNTDEEQIYKFDLIKKEVEILAILNKYGFEEIRKVNDNINNMIISIILEKEEKK